MTHLWHAFVLALSLVTLASAEGPASTTHLWAPVFPQAAISTAFASTNDLRCGEWVPEIGITGVTQMAFFIASALGAGTFCGVAIYTGNGATLIASTGALDCSNAIAVGTSALPAFSLTGGTKYLLCACGSATGGGYLSPGTTNADNTALEVLMNAITPTIGLDAGAVCTAGAPPAGPLTLSAVQTQPPYILFATPTP